MEQRRHPRVQLPLLVDLRHPSEGHVRCTARDISEGGVFVMLQGSSLRAGAKVKLTLLNAMGVEAQPTPSVDMEVVRVESEGLGLAFANAAGRHLWQSVERLRTELAIGRDYFQVHLNALVINQDNALMLVQQHGRWTFPAVFLQVGADWRCALSELLERDFDLRAVTVGELISATSHGTPELPEAALLDLFAEVRADASACRRAAECRYTALRWADSRRMLEDVTFASEPLRELARRLMARLVKEDTGTPP